MQYSPCSPTSPPSPIPHPTSTIPSVHRLIPCPISEKAQATPDHPALLTDSATWTYADLDRATWSLAHILRQEAPKQGSIRERQKIAFVAGNDPNGDPSNDSNNNPNSDSNGNLTSNSDPATIVLFFALLRLGAIACPLSHRLPNATLSGHLEQLKADHFLNSHYLNSHFLNLLPQPASPHPAANRRDPLPTAWLASLSLDALATFLFTSGSSGRPKIACHTVANHYFNALGSLQRLKLTPSSRWLLSLPLFHVSGIGILFRCFQRGATVVLSRKTMAQALSDFQISHLSLVPTQLYRLLQESSLPSASSLRCILLGGAPIPPSLLKRAKERQLPIYATYGLTETSSMVLLSGENPDTPAGKPLPFREIRIDAEGEIQLRGRTLFQGYWDAQSGHIVPATREGWFPTGDRGRWLPSGDLEVVGRKDRMFISGGENIHPEEIERALLNVPGIRKAFVLPVADPEFGERPIACIDDTTGSHTLQSLRAALAGDLPSFKHPVRIFPWPVEAGIKPDPVLLREHLKALADHQG